MSGCVGGLDGYFYRVCVLNETTLDIIPPKVLKMCRSKVLHAPIWTEQMALLIRLSCLVIPLFTMRRVDICQLVINKVENVISTVAKHQEIKILLP